MHFVSHTVPPLIVVLLFVMACGCSDEDQLAPGNTRDDSGKTGTQLREPSSSSELKEATEQERGQRLGPPRREDSKRWALLVGCGEYARPIPQLRGPANDLILMERLLKKFGYDDGDIRSLSDSLGETSWPTRANIEREFKHLTENVGRGDQVFIMLAGHGSQQPDLDPKDSVDYEPDGLDEIFLPRDVGRWIPGQKVRNSIVDDELREWLTRLVERGAFVVFVADTCCSGTMARGDSDAGLTARHVDSVEMLGVPEALGSSVNPEPTGPSLKRSSVNDAAEDWLDITIKKKDGRGMVAIYAVQPDQKEWELAIGGGIHGQLSYMLFQILDGAQSPVTWRDLAQRLRYEYRAKRWHHRSQPGIEGTDLSRPVLSLDQWPVAASIILSKADGEWTINRGLLHGISPGTVLAVRNPAGSEDVDSIHGYVRARKCEALVSQVEPVAFNGRQENSGLSGLCRCEVVLRKTDDIRLSVQIQHEGFPSARAASGARDRLQVVLDGITERDGSLIRLTKQRADWYAIATPAGIWLQRNGSRLPLDSAVSDTTGERFGPFSSENLDFILDDHLTQIAKAENLLRLSDGAAVGERQLVRIETGIECDGKPLPTDVPHDVRLYDKNRIRLTIRNAGSTNIAVRVFYVESQCAIKPFFPRAGDEFTADVRSNDIPPGEMLKARPIEFTINASTTGPENLIVVAVPTSDSHVLDELSVLEQPGPVENFQSRSRKPSVSVPVSPLARFLDSMVSNTRGGTLASVPEASRYSIRRVGWNVVESKAKPK